MSIVYGKFDIAALSPIAQKLDALLKADGFSMLEARRFIGADDQAVYDITYVDGKEERVFITAHWPRKASA